LDWSSTATTCDPASIANSISVAVGESETMWCGTRGMVTLAPLDSLMVTGKRSDCDCVFGCVALPHAQMMNVAATTAAWSGRASFALAVC
jgi:hypothetical protein